MQTVGEMFHSLERDEVIASISRLYPNEPSANFDGYRIAWENIKNKQAAAATDMVVELYMAESFDDPSKLYVSVHGRDGAGQAWAIEYSPWAEWMAMPVRVLPAVGEISATEVLAHILWEMTWAGFDDDRIADRLQEINDLADEVRESVDLKPQAH